MISVFCTNIGNIAHAREVREALKELFPLAKVTVDLMDVDKVLRVEAPLLKPADIIACLAFMGYICNELED